MIDRKEIRAFIIQRFSETFKYLASDSGSDPTGGDALAAPGETSQSGGANAAHRPTSSTSPGASNVQ